MISDAMNRCMNEHRGACPYKFFCFFSKAKLKLLLNPALEPARVRSLCQTFRDVDGLRMHINRLLRNVVKHKLSMCLSFFVSIFRILSHSFIWLSAKPTKLNLNLKPNGISSAYEVPYSCPADCHGECSSCALM